MGNIHYLHMHYKKKLRTHRLIKENKNCPKSYFPKIITINIFDKHLIVYYNFIQMRSHYLCHSTFSPGIISVNNSFNIYLAPGMYLAVA